jgi:plasmid stabilization system protein ParE
VSAAFVLHPAAEAKLREIVRYTRKQWGAAQAREYAAKLRQSILALAAGKKPFKDMSSLYPGLRTARCGGHHIFCLCRQDAPALVAAILHERMDVMARLKQRLN